MDNGTDNERERNCCASPLGRRRLRRSQQRWESEALRNIAGLLERVEPNDGPTVGSVITALDADREGSSEELVAWLEQRGACTPVQPGVGPTFNWGNGAINADWVPNHWAAGAGAGLSSMTSLFCRALSGEELLGLASGSPHFDARLESPHTPLQVLYRNPELHAELSLVCREAFGVGVVLDPTATSSLYLRMGEAKSPATTVPPSLEDLDYYEALPLVERQGDGVKSFIGVMLTLIAGRYSVVTLDEPEAFLHPPQAYQLGRNLAELVPSGMQLFVAHA